MINIKHKQEHALISDVNMVLPTGTNLTVVFE